MPPDSEQDSADDTEDFVEIDPSRRYGRYKEVLGKGAFKKVYRAFDVLEGREVAWNQVKVADLLRNSEDLERLYSEVHLLKTLKHKSIMKFYNSWVDTQHSHINFITEIFTSGTLRQYRRKHKQVDLRALKKWSRQILDGLLYLHSHDPPVIHRDLKCDNIFVNGNQGEIKIGDLGLAAILRKAHSAHSVIGTPEFMAPELYEEEYNELVDVYAFGMCLLELVTFEYPYVECANAAQIFKKVTSGIKPASLEKVRDPGVREFIEKCIAKVSERLPAKELLMDPFLRSDNENCIDRSLAPNAQYIDSGHDQIPKEDEAESSKGFTVQGQMKDENTIFLKLRIADFAGQVRNIHFPFDIEVDTAVAVASEMVEELDLTYQDVSTIAEIIDSEIRSHIPDWEPRVKSEHCLEEEGESGESASPLKDDASPSSHGLILERTHSGRKYWSDFPKAAGNSPGKSALSNVSSEAEPLTSRDSVVDFNEQPLDSEPNVHDGNTSPIREAGDGFVNDTDRTIEKNDSIELGDSNSAAPETQSDSVTHLSDDDKSLSDIDSEDVKLISEDLEHLLTEQKKEVDELKRRHELAISVLMKKLSPDIRKKVFNICNLRVRGNAKLNTSSNGLLFH